MSTHRDKSPPYTAADFAIGLIFVVTVGLLVLGVAP